MKIIYVIHKDDEVFSAYYTMNDAVTAAINRLITFGYSCEDFDYEAERTIIQYRDFEEKTRYMTIEAIMLKDRV